MQANSQFVDTKPGPNHRNVTRGGQHRKSSFPDHAPPARVQNQRIPNDNDERTIFFRVPAPKSAPGVISPEASQHGSHKTEEDCKADDSVDDPRGRFSHCG